MLTKLWRKAGTASLLVLFWCHSQGIRLLPQRGQEECLPYSTPCCRLALRWPTDHEVGEVLYDELLVIVTQV